ncbi:hypothetical protein [Serratia phage vB_SmaS_Opt-169]|uniref:Uncharacterized protein n=1 Tax=Serratia phage vB_SmaS_Rovert TaxID=2777363 RepID=A0A7T3TKW4_9CAUD|nr:hypothetical protein QJS24_gp41 [Serratia phage vB_SmaS_Rovert]QPX75008.1 hypothetical protein [Serratia phage vB_SmaS_Rovert]QPX75454.1 hypothetical protein [Serratia phage vB_SmaS_Opt-169]
MLMTRYEKGVALAAIAKVMMINAVDLDTAMHFIYDNQRRLFMMNEGVDVLRAEKLLKVSAEKLISDETADYAYEARPVREMVEEFNLKRCPSITINESDPHTDSEGVFK